ncbi:hypothetical protein ACFYUD_03780 [Nocardia tengchongensis]|uniref:hypothetical protein n=1 Tax=Nocardia tengchongensis TaxID=2055889 RepID=UPI00367BB021
MRGNTEHSIARGPNHAADIPRQGRSGDRDCPTLYATGQDSFLVQGTTIETITAELTITQPREIAVYGRTFDMLAELSVIGDAARALIMVTVDRLRTLS